MIVLCRMRHKGSGTGRVAGPAVKLVPQDELVNSSLQLVSLLVDDYDDAIAFFTDVLGFELVEDSPSETTDGAPKRWVVVRPPGAQTGLLLARADGAEQRARIGDQAAGRVGFFLQVDDFDAVHQRLITANVEIIRGPSTQPYGQVLVFCDIAGNRWDLLGPAPTSAPEHEPEHQGSST